MTKSAIFILSLLPICLLYGQETKLVTKKRDKYYEEYTVLTTDKKIKHGHYIKLNKRLIGSYAIEISGQYNHGVKTGLWETYYGLSNSIESRGFYKNDERDSVWIFFFPESIPLELVEVQTDQGTYLQVEGANPVQYKTGKYKAGKAVGRWEYFDREGQLTHIYDHDISEITYLKSHTKEKTEDTENHTAGFIDGDLLLHYYLYNTFDFNDLMTSITNLVIIDSGKLEFKFAIDTTGSVKDIVCTEQTITNKKFYSKAIELIESLNGLWYPKKVNGNKMPSERYITFTLNKDSNTRYSTLGNSSVSTSSLNYNLNISLVNKLNE